MMSGQSIPRNLKKQPEPQPPNFVQQTTPSLFAYLFLFCISLSMIFIAFRIYGPDWSGLLINLATGLIGTVIILIFVDHRLRINELQMIQDLAIGLSVQIRMVFSGDIRTTINYSTRISQQLIRIRPTYIERPTLETLLDVNPEGFILHSGSGMGKTTLVQSIALKQVEKVLQLPKTELIPIFVRISHWVDGDLLLHIWKEISKYIRCRHSILEKWLRYGRVVIIIDAINEHVEPKNILREILYFRKQFPNVPLIITSRTSVLSLLMDSMKKLNLPIIEIPDFTDKEMEIIYKKYFV